MEITKELINRLCGGEMKVKEYKEAIAAISNKVDGIWRFLVKDSGRNIDWWAFQNDRSFGHGNGSSGGEFDPENDSEWITIIGDVSCCDIPDYAYDDGFPTSFLWDDYRKIHKDHMTTIKEAEQKRKTTTKSKKEDKKKRDGELMESIKGKLTEEEWKLVKKAFK